MTEFEDNLWVAVVREYGDELVRQGSGDNHVVRTVSGGGKIRTYSGGGNNHVVRMYCP